MSLFFSEIDWTRPWYASLDLASLQPGFHEAWRTHFNGLLVERQLKNHRDLALSLIAQEDLPEGRAYEEHISQTGCIPTRENLHDFFNAMVWLSFPKIKRQLNAMQAAQIAQLGVGKMRGPARDAATIFDENAALLVVRDDPDGRAFVNQLMQHEWMSALFEQAHQFGTTWQLWCFGHALMEKLVHPYKAITTHCKLVWLDAAAADAYFSLDHLGQAAYLDDVVAQNLLACGLSNKDYTPLPILGVPGWWPQQDVPFYSDRQVFREKRLK
jgi:hypothetical protein